MLLRYYCCWVLGPWDMEAELKCFALSGFLLCNFTDLYCVTELTMLFTQTIYQEISASIWLLFNTL